MTNTGKRMPVDAEPDPAGLFVLVTTPGLDGEGPIIKAVDSRTADGCGPAGLKNILRGLPRHKSHFATCPHANQHRRSTDDK